jgi:hypothetical protein
LRCQAAGPPYVGDLCLPVVSIQESYSALRGRIAELAARARKTRRIPEIIEGVRPASMWRALEVDEHIQVDQWQYLFIERTLTYNTDLWSDRFRQNLLEITIKMDAFVLHASTPRKFRA